MPEPMPVPRTCAKCGKWGGTVAFRFRKKMNGKLQDVRDYYHPRCARKVQIELDKEQHGKR